MDAHSHGVDASALAGHTPGARRSPRPIDNYAIDDRPADEADAGAVHRRDTATWVYRTLTAMFRRGVAGCFVLLEGTCDVLREPPVVIFSGGPGFIPRPDHIIDALTRADGGPRRLEQLRLSLVRMGPGWSAHRIYSSIASFSPARRRRTRRA